MRTSLGQSVLDRYYRGLKASNQKTHLVHVDLKPYRDKFGKDQGETGWVTLTQDPYGRFGVTSKLQVPIAAIYLGGSSNEHVVSFYIPPDDKQMSALNELVMRLVDGMPRQLGQLHSYTKLSSPFFDKNREAEDLSQKLAINRRLLWGALAALPLAIGIGIGLGYFLLGNGSNAQTHSNVTAPVR